MSCLAPSEHYRACISITEMNRIERGISHRTRSNIVCFSALKHQSRSSLNVYELCIQTEGHIDGYNTCKTFIISHVVNASSFFSALRIQMNLKNRNKFSFGGDFETKDSFTFRLNQWESYFKIQLHKNAEPSFFFFHVFQLLLTFFLI